jgi:hypothetical protein
MPDSGQWVHFGLRPEPFHALLSNSSGAFFVRDVRLTHPSGTALRPDLHRDGFALGHSDALVAAAAEFEADGWSYRRVFDRLAEEGAVNSRNNSRNRRFRLMCATAHAGGRLLTSLHSGCRRVDPTPPSSPMSKYGYRALYTNAYVQRGQRLHAIPAGTPLGAPQPVAQDWRWDTDDPPFPPARDQRRVEGHSFHTDGGDRSLITLWVPIIQAEPVAQWPIVWIDPESMRGCDSVGADRQHSDCRPGQPSDRIRGRRSFAAAAAAAAAGAAGAAGAAAGASDGAGDDGNGANTDDRVEPRLLHWAGMALGDYVAWDGARILHGTGLAVGEGVRASAPRTAFSATFHCVPLADEPGLVLPAEPPIQSEL